MHPAAGLIVAYVVGSFPSAYLAGRMLKGIDLRTVGSGNLGATNVFRTLGWKAGLAVLLLDAAKGALPVYVLPRLMGFPDLSSDAALWWALSYGVAAIAGHAKPIFLLWKGGGKGVATASGVFVVLVPVALFTTTAICALVVRFTGYMSAGSLVAALIFPLFVWLDRGVSPVFWMSLVVGAFIWWTHRANLARLRAGTESRIYQKRERGT